MANLRAVQEGEKPPGRKRQTVTEAAAGGDQRELLVAMRDRIARAVSDEKCPPRDLASLTKRLDDIAEKIKVIDAEADEESADGGPVADEEWDAEAL